VIGRKTMIEKNLIQEMKETELKSAQKIDKYNRNRIERLA
jgi:hypothetical protein